MDQLIAKAAASKRPHADPAATTELLSQHDTSMGWRGFQGRGALQFADLWDIAVVRLLLDHGAGPLVRDSSGNSPLALAAHHKYQDVIALMLQAIDAQDEPFEVVATYIVEAKREAQEVKHNWLMDDVNEEKVVGMLQQYYWRRRYPV